MFYIDFTPYSYAYTGEETPRPYNIGWLDFTEQYEKGSVSEDFKSGLFSLCKIRFEQTRGYHGCPFCKCLGEVVEERDGTVLRLGSAEIRVHGKDGKIYASPNLIYHYVVSHEYRPPYDFICAVLWEIGSCKS